MNNAVKEIKKTIFDIPASQPAAIAIQESLSNLLVSGVMTQEEFISLIDLDNKSQWLDLSKDIAERIAAEAKCGAISSRDVKPWVRCKGYRDKFGEIADIRAWRSANGAISSLMSLVDGIFKGDDR